MHTDITVITEKYFLQKFSEKDCEGLMDAMYHCGWHRIQDTVDKIESNIPPLPDNVQTRFHGFNIVGDFGDGYEML